MAGRGGANRGQGRKTKFETEQKLKKELAEYVPTINVHAELEKCYKELKKVKTKEDLMIVDAKINLLSKLAPYTLHKRGVAAEEDNKIDLPEMTVISVKGKSGELPEEDEEDGKGDFV